MLRGADSFPDEEHGSFVALALADHDRAVHRHFVHHFPHRFDGGLIGLMSVAQPHRLCRFDCRFFDDAQKFQTQFDFHLLSQVIKIFELGAFGHGLRARYRQTCPIS